MVRHLCGPSCLRRGHSGRGRSTATGSCRCAVEGSKVVRTGAGCEWTSTVLSRDLLRAESAGPVTELVRCLPDKDGG